MNQIITKKQSKSQYSSQISTVLILQNGIELHAKTSSQIKTPTMSQRRLLLPLHTLKQSFAQSSSKSTKNCNLITAAI